MIRQRQDGMLMLSMALMLAVLGALAYVMSREGAMTAHTVDAQYDTENARYLALAGLTLARWGNEQLGCKSAVSIPPTDFALHGKLSATVSLASGNTLDINALGVSTNGAKSTLSRTQVVVHDLSKPKNTDLDSDKNVDSWLDSSAPLLNKNGSPYLELTQNSANGLLSFATGAVKNNSLILSATLALYEVQAVSTSPGLTVSVRRVLRNWDANTVSWKVAKATSVPPLWSTAGGDYSSASVASANLAGVNYTTTWNVRALVDGWVNGGFDNNGLLLHPDGALQQVQFASFQNSSFPRPKITVAYVPPC